jgi:hypothetical protein
VNQYQADQMIAAELRSWAVKELWRRLDAADVESYLKLCRKFGVSTDISRKCQYCCEPFVNQHVRPDKIYCSDQCQTWARKDRQSQPHVPGQ